MAKHDVTFTLPERPLGKADIDFGVNRDGEFLGTFKLSKGGVDWRPKGGKKPNPISWGRLAKLIENYKAKKISRS